MLYRAQICGETSCGLGRYVIVEWSRDERQALRRARQRAYETRLTIPSLAEVVTFAAELPCDDCGRITAAEHLRTDIGNRPVCIECAAKAVHALDPPPCRRCGVTLGDYERDHGDLCMQCADEAHERDTFDHKRIHSAGYGGSI